MKRPVLVIMAAGMGSRYGGLKQIDPVDEQGHIIMDFSIYDAVEAGFQEVIFIIKREHEADFRAAIGDRLSEFVKVHYVYQELSDLPEGYTVPEGRMKPWGTGHAVLSCIYVLNEAPFAVINADDYYGKHAFSLIYDYLLCHQDDEKYHYAMVGYRLGNTLTENGHVSRGVCQIDDQGYLMNICEHTHIEKRGDGAVYTEDDGMTWQDISVEGTVSMNLWGFTDSFLDELQNRFTRFLDDNIEHNPLKSEYFLPTVVNELLEEEKADVQVRISKDRWYGVTYKEDKPLVVDSIRKMKEEGLYPEYLWKEENHHRRAL
ncbi:MAG TPA: nucleotidyltransferase [Candidatus Pelethocola excrementipullorum]|nr:nucleotidyltransferase [Candidatus Pelethocola excrementipullorum]